MVSEENSLIVLPYQNFSAEMNMMIDHSIALAMNEIKSPIIRFYGWKPFAVSYGYHQNITDFNQKKIINDGYDIVRRPTGGRAIFHADELTYAIIIPKTMMSKFDLYKRTHSAFRDTIKKFISNIDLSKKRINFADFYKDKKSAACFSASARFEVGVNNKKLVGSAQRIYPHAILQHGSIMLGDTHLNIVNYLNIDEETKKSIRDELMRTTSHLNLLEFNINKKELGERFLDCIVSELSINSIKKIEYQNLNIEMVALQ